MSDNNEITKMATAEIEAIFSLLGTRREGLTNQEAEKRLLLYGMNQLPKAVTLSLWRLLYQQFTHFMALLLWAAGILAFLVNMPELGWATWSVVFINALFSFWQEYRADKALLALSAMLPRKVKVYRNGRIEQVLSEEIVIGDVLVIEAGDHISADARLVEAENLMVDLSLLTGESLPVACNAVSMADTGKPASRTPNLLFAGTTATSGRGIAVVYAAGKQTELGKVTKMTTEVVREKSSLELQVQRIVRLITTLALSMGAIVFALAYWWLGIDLRACFIFCIGIIVANVPEGLLPAVSLSLAVGVRRMASQNALVRKLSSVEALCATSVICTDKTGTITMNEVTVKRIWVPEFEVEVSGDGYEKEGALAIPSSAIENQIELLLTIGVVCSEAIIETDYKNDKLWQIIGDPTEGALLVAAAKGGQDIAAVRADFSGQITKQFNSVHKMMSTFGVNNRNRLFKQGVNVKFVKGAPIETLRSCRYIKNKNEIVEISEAERQKIIGVNDRLAREGHRVLALAYSEGLMASESSEYDLVFVGLAAMIDPPRPEVAEAVKQCQQAGIRVTMITGDYGLTAEAVGRHIGLVKDKGTIVTGTELESMDGESLKNLLRQDQPIIFARATPAHKLKIVEAYKACGHIVAVTGDGVNDAPALKAADIGIAMGRGGTDVAREVADIVLLDDNFATIVKAIEQGRAIYDNIRKFMTYIFASNIPEIIPFIAMIFLKIPPALNILQILAIDIGTDMVPALALGAEHPEKGILHHSPARYSRNLLDRSLLLRSYGFLGIIEAAMSMGGFFIVWSNYGYSLTDIQQFAPQIYADTADVSVREVYRQATTMAMVAIIACQMGNVFVCRSELLPFWQFSLKSNFLIQVGIISELLITVALIYLPFFAAIFMTQPLGLSDLIYLFCCPVILITLEEARRFLFRRF
ncbi:MAG: cation-transporting ATPase, type [Firmicutes bacterium]|nr:cation-transporting ATPase, type [Bacillota bacterium]